MHQALLPAGLETADLELVEKLANSAALRPMNQENLSQDAMVVIPWRLDLSLRTPEASEFHQLLLKLSSNGIP